MVFLLIVLLEINTSPSRSSSLLIGIFKCWQLCINNYRPISVLPICMKIFEKLVHKQLSVYLDRNNIISENQSGFRPMHSTQTCLLKVSDYLLENMNSGNFTGAVFLDLKKAFDTVHHGRLIRKLHHFGVRGLELDWFSSFLNGRRRQQKLVTTIPL